ncbi:MAG: sialidase family protein, partial [Chloroflexota bacterium]
WFERNRLEIHPNNAPPFNVQLGRLGADRLEQQGRDWTTFPQSEAQAGCRFFAETGHNVCNDILTSWRSSGLELDGVNGTSEAESLALFGLPLSDAQTETLSDGREYTVQWFERARFEIHPENEPPFNVLLGLLGNEIRGTGGEAPATASCEGVPIPVNAEVTPALCMNQGETLNVRLLGFQSGERIDPWLTTPDQRVLRLDQSPQIAPNDDPEGFAITTIGLSPGVWFWTFRGVETDHTAIVYFRVVSNPNQTTPQLTNAVIEWDEPEHIPNPSGGAIFPWAVIDNYNTIHIVYASTEGSLWYTNDATGQFEPPQLIETELGTNREPFAALAMSPDNILHLVYVLRGGDEQVYYRQARLQGNIAAWSEPELISDGVRSFGAHLAVDNQSNAHIVWIDRRCGEYNVYYRMRYADGSLSEVSAPRDDCIYQNRPQVTITQDNTPHIVFQYDREIYYARLEAGGWTSGSLSQSPRVSSSNPTIDSQGNELYVAWDEGVNGHDIVFRHSSDSGQSWSDETIALSDTPNFASFPSVTYAPTNGRVYTVWSDATRRRSGRTDIWYRSFSPANGTISEVERLAKREGNSFLPVMTTGPNRAAVVWQDRNDDDQWELYIITGAFVINEED